MQAHYFTVSGPAYTGQAPRSGGTHTALRGGGMDPAPLLRLQRMYGHQPGGCPTKPDFFAAGFGGCGVFTKAGVAASFGAAAPLLEALFLPPPPSDRMMAPSLLYGRTGTKVYALQTQPARSGGMCLPDLRLLADEALPRRARGAGWRPDVSRPVPEPAEVRSTSLDEAGPSSTPPGGAGVASDTRLKQQQQRHGGRCLVPEHASTTAEVGSREEVGAAEEDSVSEGPAWGNLWRISEDGSSGEEGGEGESDGCAGDVPLGQR